MDIVNKAIEVAAVAHAGQVRKGTNIPYISHPYAIGMMLRGAGCSDTVVAAGILHDTVEDTPVTLSSIRERFGPDVAAIVEGCSEPHKSDLWETRKQHTLAYLPHAPWEVRMVACADKLHNARTILDEYEHVGDKVWDRFNKGRDKQEWYYRGLVEALCTHPDGQRDIPFCADLEAAVERLFAGSKA